VALERVVERGAERPEIARGARLAVPGPFGRHVRRRADQHPGAGDRRVTGRRGQPEVAEHDPTILLRDEHVAGLDVAVQHAAAMRGPQRGQHAEADPGDRGHVQSSLLGHDLLQ
jgi:hypothetical protein